MVTHGHYYCVSTGHELLRDEGKARDFDIIMFGHTHKPVIDRSGGITILNPGSLTYPRQEGKRPSYIVMEIEEGGAVHFSLEYL